MYAVLDTVCFCVVLCGAGIVGIIFIMLGGEYDLTP
jgi:hypothetical protein